MLNSLKQRVAPVDSVTRGINEGLIKEISGQDMKRGSVTPAIIIVLFAGLLTGSCNASGWYTAVRSCHTGERISIPDKKKQKKNQEGTAAVAGNTSQLIDAKKEAIIGNLKGARELFRKYVESYPGDPVGYYELARIEVMLKNPADAVTLAQKAVQLNPDRIWYQLFLAELYQMSGKPAEAIPIYEKVVTDNPENPDYQYQLAALYLQDEKFREAIGVYNRIEEETGVSEEISLQKQKIYLHLNDLENAENEVQKLIAAFPGDSKYQAILAEFYLANNMPEKALATYRKITKPTRRNPNQCRW